MSERAFSGGMGKLVLGGPDSTGVAPVSSCFVLMQPLIELAIITAAASVINLVDAEEFTSMLVLKLSGANILHAPESIDPTSAETWIQAVQSSIFRLSSFHSCKLKLEL